MIHGHQHKNYGKAYQQESWYKDTLVINAYVSYILEIPDELLQKRG